MADNLTPASIMNLRSTHILLPLLITGGLLFFLYYPVFAQKQKADSIKKMLTTETIDSNRVTLLWRLADYSNIYNPDSALIFANEALELARSIHFTEGESRTLGILSNTFLKIGNYPRALEYNLKKLQLEEKRNNPRNLASVLMNIGAVHSYQDEYRKALEYYYKSDSVISVHQLHQLKFFVTLNIGDAYDKLNVLDSAFLYYNLSLREANKLQLENFIGASLTGLAHIYRKQSNFLLASSHYDSAIVHLHATNDDDLLCEAELGLARLYAQFNKPAEAVRHATNSYLLAKKDGFDSRQLDAAKFLSEHFHLLNKTDSAYFYLSRVLILNDSLNSKNKIRESQILASNEQLRQLQLEETKRKAQKIRSQQLQMLFIGMFIPALFLLTLLLSKAKLHIRLIRLLGVLSLLVFFEYLTLLLHPTVASLTHHTPIYEILIFVVIAAILIPLHHRTEHWLIHKLLHHRIQPTAFTTEEKKSPPV